MSSRLGAPGATRTPDPLLRRQLLYPLSYRRPEHNDESQSRMTNGTRRLVIARLSLVIRVNARLARPERIELPTCLFEASRSIRLSYGRLSLVIDNCRLTTTIRNHKIDNGTWGERRDLNPQPLEPQSSALTN